MNNRPIALLTSRYWEGSYTLKQILDNNLPCHEVLVQRTWWREHNSFAYSQHYIEERNREKSSTNRRHFTIEELAENSGVRVHYIDSINSKRSITLLDSINPGLINVVGSPIIKKVVLKRFGGKIINYHTGILPQYRGPYSEFWALYNNERMMIGTTIHFIDSGIDTGDILSSETVSVQTADPQEAHIINAVNGAKLMAETIKDYIAGKITPRQQDASKANYYTFPTEEQITSYEKRIGKKIELYFAD